MTVEEVLESQKKIQSIYHCVKCKDKKEFYSREKKIEKCREC